MPLFIFFYCFNLQAETFRPAITPRKTFDHFHGMSHPSSRSTTKMIVDWFICKNLRQIIRQWGKHYPTCQASKLHKHTRSVLFAFPLPDDPFRHINADMVGPLPPSNSFTDNLTCIDRLAYRSSIEWYLIWNGGKKASGLWISTFGFP